MITGLTGGGRAVSRCWLGRDHGELVCRNHQAAVIVSGWGRLARRCFRAEGAARLRRLTVLLRALLDSPELRLRLLVGEDALDRPVAGVYTTDLLDPRRYLSGGEIVLTGLMWRRTPADSEVFVATLVACGAAALAAGDAALGSVPGDLVDACRRHQLPLF